MNLHVSFFPFKFCLHGLFDTGYEADGYTRLDGTVDYVKYYNILYGHGDDAPAASAAAGGAPPTAGAAVASGTGAVPVNGAASSTDVSTAGSEARAAKRVRPAGMVCSFRTSDFITYLAVGHDVMWYLWC